MGLIRLDPAQQSTESQRLLAFMGKDLLFQDRALSRVAALYARKNSPFSHNNGPLGVAFFPGPSGVGKSETVRLFTSFVLGHRSMCTFIKCSEYRQPHSVLRLIGAPPSYIGYYDPLKEKGGGTTSP